MLLEKLNQAKYYQSGMDQVCQMAQVQRWRQWDLVAA
jgi:hypothetical protein